MTAKSDQPDGQWRQRRRPGAPMQQRAPGPDGPRFERFAAAMDNARATGAPETKLYCDPEPGERAPDAPRPYPDGERRRPLVPAYAGSAPLIAFLPGRVILQWVGIAGCILLFSVLLAHWAIRTNVAETAQLFGARFGAAPGEQVAPDPERPPVALPGPEAPADDGASEVTVARVEALLTAAAAWPTTAEPLAPAAAPTEAGTSDARQAGFPPLPQFKPAAAGE
jgi:hypothetical protein